jgi:hypothetical protein
MLEMHMAAGGADVLPPSSRSSLSRSRYFIGSRNDNRTRVIVVSDRIAGATLRGERSPGDDG